MSQISASDVKKLRDITGVGMMDCKKALEESAGDMQKAVEYLRKKGAALAAKREGKETGEGMICIRIASDRKSGVILELNCETDFVARGDDFTAFAGTLADQALSARIASVEAMLGHKLGDAYSGETAENAMTTLTGKMGEKIQLKHLVFCDAADGIVEGYTHPGAQLGAIVRLATDKPELAGDLAKDLAMQVAASAPLVTSRADVPADYIARESEIYRQQALGQGKKEEFVDKIVTGRLEKYYQEVVITEQPFIKDSTMKVSDVLADFRKKHQAKVDVSAFVRYQLGE
jgi:elongation factor Ts